MNNISTHDLIARILSNEATDEEQKIASTLLNTDATFRQVFQESKQIWEKAQKTDDAVDVDAAWENFYPKLRQIPRQSSRPYQYLWKVAAAIVFLAGGGLFLTKLYLDTNVVSVYTAANEIKEVTLPDGSIVILNYLSGITYESKFKGDERLVKLTGEAFFDVKRDENKPFIVQTEYSTTKVLGTSFNLKADSATGLVELAVASGKVKFISVNAEEELLLTAGQGAYITNKGKTISANTPDVNTLAWKNRKLVFNDASFKEVVTAVEKYFNIHIQVNNDSIYACRITAEFEEPTLTEVMDIISKTLQLNYTVQDRTVTVSGKGCK